MSCLCDGSSLPSRERGLKFLLLILINIDIKSLPSRERGLKLAVFSVADVNNIVAPFAGAWIEILDSR